MVRIARLDWRPDRIEHVARHGVGAYEVEEAVRDGRNHVRRAGPAERNPDETIYRVYGRTEAGRYLFVALLIYESGDEALPMTARDATDQEKRRYMR